MDKNKFIRYLQILTAALLGITASMILIFENNAHVTMCMFSAICYSLGLLFKKGKIASFFSGGILFYTIYAGTTLLLLGWFGILEEEFGGEGYLFIDAAWLYHFLINFAVLVMFFTKKDNMKYVLTGLEVFMITSPIMLLIRELFDRVLWGETGRIIIYVTVGIVLFIIHRFLILFTQERYPEILKKIRKVMIISLFVYAVLLVVAIPVNKIIADKSPPEQRNGSYDSPRDEPSPTDQALYEKLEWVEGALTQPLPANASKTRLSLPVSIDDLMPGGSPITAFGAHIGQHVEGMDHSWIGIKKGIPARSWADGTVVNVQLNGDEYFIYLDYGDGLACAFGEIETPLVTEGQEVKHMDPIGEVSYFASFDAGEMEIYCADANRNDGIKPSAGGNQTGTAVSPFDYLNDQDKALLEEAYIQKVVNPSLEGQSFGQSWYPADPFLNNKMMIHKENEIVGEWFLVEKKWNGNDLSLLSFLDVNKYSQETYMFLRGENENLIAKTYIDGTYEVVSDGNKGTVTIYDQVSQSTYYGLYEITEGAGVDSTGEKKAQMKFEFSETPVSEFSDKALTYQERGVYNPRYDAWKLGGWVNYQ